jgi:PAS domain S-box-containing protein
MAKKEAPLASAMPKEDFRREGKGLHQQLKEIIKIQEQKERKRVQETRKKYYSYLDKIADPVFIYDAITYRFLHCNESFIKNFGYSEEEILSMTPFDLHKPEDFEKVRENIEKRTVDTPKTFTYLTKDRRQRIVEIMTEDIFFEGNPAWMTVVHDITEHIVTEEELKKSRLRLEEILGERREEVLLATQKLTREIEERMKAEDAIRESEVKFRNIIEKSLDGIILVDEKGSIIEWNSGQETIYGVKRAMVAGKKIWDVQFQHEPREKRVDENYKEIKNLWENFLTTGINPFQNREQVSKIERPDGQLRDIQQLYFTIETDKGKGFMMACTTRDITSRLVMEKQLIQSQKMEAMGTLAGGIAHDFNNILGGIIGYTELAVRTLDKKSPVQKYLKQVLTASKRASDLVKQILIFSRRETKEKEPVQMSLIAKEAIKLLRSSLPATIEIVSKIKDDKSFILADPTQIHQVIMNLCTNAAHAMKEKGGIMEVRLNKETVEPGLYKELKAGPHLRLSISDTGHGIKQELIDKIFEPFFTTKQAEEGTGMGLAVVHGIVKSHNGNISVYSKEGEGTTFSILLPIVVDVIHKQEKKEEEIPGGNERILLVEDDTSLAEAEKKLFEELGYNVTKVTSGIEAFEIFRTVPDRFDIIISDYSMPKMTGGELISKIRSFNPDIPVILCTGFSDVITPSKARSLRIGDIIMKPIELGQIAKSIRKLLEKK